MAHFYRGDFMKHLPININELIDAIEDEGEAYLDSDTGEVISFPEESIFAEEDADDSDWREEIRILTKKVSEDKIGRYIEIPTIESFESFKYMEEFLATVTNNKPHEHLSRALCGKRPFRAFKDALCYYPEERERWFNFKNSKIEQYGKNWLEAQGIELKQMAKV